MAEEILPIQSQQLPVEMSALQQPLPLQAQEQEIGQQAQPVRQTSKAIHPMMTAQRIEELEKTLYEIHKSASESSLRKDLISRIKDNRAMMYDEDLGFLDFPWDNASNRNIPTIPTVIDGYLDSSVNAAVNTFPKLEILKKGPQEFSASEKKLLNDMFEEHIALGEFDLAGFYNEFFKTIYVDGICAIRTVKEEVYSYREETRPFQAWYQDPKFKEEYESQMIDVMGVNFIDPLLIPAEYPITLRVKDVISKPVMTYHPIEEILFNADSYNGFKFDWITISQQACMDDLRRWTLANIYDPLKVDEIWDIVKSDTQKKYKGDGFTDEVHINSLVGRNTVQKNECYINYDINLDGIDELCLVEFISINGMQEDGKVYITRAIQYDKDNFPIVVATFDKESKLLLKAKSLADSIYSLHSIINKIFNDNMDNNTLQNVSIVKYKAGKGYSGDDYIFAPSNRWPVEDMNDVQIERMPEIKGSSFQLEQLANAYVANRTGRNAFAPTGVQNIATNTTLGGLQTILAQGGAKIERKIRLLLPYLNKAFQLYFNILVNRTDLKVIVNLNLFNISKQVNIQMAENLFNILSKTPEFITLPAFRRNAVEMIFDALGKDGFEELWPKELAQLLTTMQQGMQPNTPPNAQNRSVQAGNPQGQGAGMHKMPDGTMMPNKMMAGGPK